MQQIHNIHMGFVLGCCLGMLHSKGARTATTSAPARPRARL
jgi:hypothetical protein